jgi:hypothetical protein
MGVLGLFFCGGFVVICVVKRGGLMVVFLGLKNTPHDLKFSVEKLKKIPSQDDSRREAAAMRTGNRISLSGMTTRKATATAGFLPLRHAQGQNDNGLGWVWRRL